MPASEYLDSMETPDTKLHATTFRCHDPRDARPHMHLLYYYFGAPDSDSADDTYDPTRECFNIDGAIASDSEDETAIGGRNTPPQVELPAERDEARFLADQGMQLEQIRELQDRLNEERENLRLLQQTLEHECAAHAHDGGARERELASSRIGQSSPQFLVEPARMLSQPPCSFVTCPSHQTPRPIEPVMKSEDSSRSLPCSRLRVPP
jgi:hypothetical protein